MRDTIQKKLVFDAVRELGCHATAEQIYEHISAVYPTISKGTVYRNLNVLSDDGEIRKIEVPGSAEHFDHNCEKHYHIVCVSCGRMSDLDMEPISSLKERVRDTHGFDYLDCDILFKGICPECKNLVSE